VTRDPRGHGGVIEGTIPAHTAADAVTLLKINHGLDVPGQYAPCILKLEAVDEPQSGVFE